MRILAKIWLGLALCCPAGATAGTPEPADWSYLDRPIAAQRKPPPVESNPILAPSPGAPALVAWGERLRVIVSLPPGVVPGLAEDWRVSLSTRTRGPDGRPIGQATELSYVLPVESLGPARTAGALTLHARVTAWPPRETYHLTVTGPGGLIGRRVHAVRVIGDADRRREFRFAALGDHQLKDPSTRFGDGDLNNRTYPHPADSDAESMLSQQMVELSFFDPDFVLYLGDLVFGTDYRAEYPQTLERYWSRPLASFMVPGNHDGMALYELALKDGWWTEALLSVRCAMHVVDQEVTALGVFKLLACLYGDLKEMLFEDLAQDGLDYWLRYLGPADYSFDLGDFHFVGLNSYSGTPERRHGFVLGLRFVGLDFGVATVDNYGGWLSPAQLAWLQRDLQAARLDGKRVILFLHHDPRGNPEQAWGARFHKNLPFPTEPLGLRMFQEWNYEGNPEWDSDPGDGRQGETQTDNSAVALLRLIAAHVDTVISGHLHDDRDEVIEAGQEIVPGSGIRVGQRLVFTRVATASSTPLRDEGYWGYRLATAGAEGLVGLVYKAAWKWPSVPAGNLWIAGEGVPADQLVPQAEPGLLYVVHNGLPGQATGLLRAYLPLATAGWRFSVTGGGQVALGDVGRSAAGRGIYYLSVRAPGPSAGKVPVPAGEEPTTRVFARPAVGNQVPEVRFSLSEEEPGAAQAIAFDAAETRDPEGAPIVAFIWEFGDGHSARGRKVLHGYDQPGRYRVSLTAVDDCGAWSSHTDSVLVAPPPSCAFSGSTCAATSAGLVVFGLLVGGWCLWRRRRASA